MRWSIWPERVPVREELDLAKGERILSSAATRGGSYVVATTQALHLPTTDGAFRRLPWEGIDQATWSEDWLHVHEEGGAPEHHIRLTDPGSVPETVRERVTSSIVVSQAARLPGGGKIRITGRRAPGGSDVRWTILFDAGLDPGDAELRAQAERILEEVRRQTGL